MTDKLKAILEEMGASGVIVDDWEISFMHKGRKVEIDVSSWFDGSWEFDIDITEAGG
jgi:hypothetical protein